mmetsp:Transcript_6279/g.18943  ORF Transcript_6279/g.18943 Transcript_6279/m.18943 type:complete len:387 (-) Transcript_6279:640-1800(-)
MDVHICGPHVVDERQGLLCATARTQAEQKLVAALGCLFQLGLLVARECLGPARRRRAGQFQCRDHAAQRSCRRPRRGRLHALQRPKHFCGRHGSTRPNDPHERRERVDVGLDAKFQHALQHKNCLVDISCRADHSIHVRGRLQGLRLLHKLGGFRGHPRSHQSSQQAPPRDLIGLQAGGPDAVKHLQHGGNVTLLCRCRYHRVERDDVGFDAARARSEKHLVRLACLARFCEGTDEHVVADDVRGQPVALHLLHGLQGKRSTTCACVRTDEAVVRHTPGPSLWSAGIEHAECLLGRSTCAQKLDERDYPSLAYLHFSATKFPYDLHGGIRVTGSSTCFQETAVYDVVGHKAVLLQLCRRPPCAPYVAKEGVAVQSDAVRHPVRLCS